MQIPNRLMICFQSCSSTKTPPLAPCLVVAGRGLRQPVAGVGESQELSEPLTGRWCGRGRACGMQRDASRGAPTSPAQPKEVSQLSGSRRTAEIIWQGRSLLFQLSIFTLFFFSISVYSEVCSAGRVLVRMPTRFYLLVDSFMDAC